MLDSSGISSSNKRTNLPKAARQPAELSGSEPLASPPGKAVFLLHPVLFLSAQQKTDPIATLLQEDGLNLTSAQILHLKLEPTDSKRRKRQQREEGKA